MLKVDLTQFTEGTLHVEGEIDPDTTQLAAAEVNFTEFLKIQVDLTRQENELMVSAIVTSSENVTCSRCLEVVDKPFEKQFDLLVDITNKTEVDLEPLIADEIFADLPIKILCKDSCKGLCPICGQNRNDADCDCQKR